MNKIERLKEWLKDPNHIQGLGMIILGIALILFGLKS